MKKTKAIALYLPQYHPIEENNKWWGPGFTEWTNTAKAKPLFKDHYQPHVPRDLGFYDLRVAETRIAQAAMAKEFGIDAFCYYHYWFAGHQLLERPFNEVLQTGEPDFPFCLCWANQTWSGVWHGSPNRVLIEQTYPGINDHLQHFQELLPAFLDKRYFCINEKPLFMIFQPTELPNPIEVTNLWRRFAHEVGLPGLYLVAQHHDPIWNPTDYGFDAVILSPKFKKRPNWVDWRSPIKKIKEKIRTTLGLPTINEYTDLIQDYQDSFSKNNQIPMVKFPCVIPNWDNTPRSGVNGVVYRNSSPELFRHHLRFAIKEANKNKSSENIIFIKSWNEWAEGNHLEPDLKYKYEYLEVLSEEINNSK